MIQLVERPAPIELSAEVATTLTQLFKTTGKSVWKQAYIERALMLLSNGKCCYCECRLGIEDKYMEVEHFLPKSIFPDEVVAWSNLLPSCRRCNGTKAAHNTQEFPIVHPINDKPSDHLKLNCSFFRDKTEKGKTTIEVLNLNDRTRLVNVRQNLCTNLIVELDKLHDLLEDYANGISTSMRRKNIIVNTFQQLLTECTPITEYAATAATIVLQQETYHTIKNLFQQHGFWNKELEALEQQALNCRLS
jgi:uncharacterized protein (TIGR02646 family)